MTEKYLLVYALIFIISFLIGGTIGLFSFPPFPGRFFVCGIVFGAFATGAGSVILK